MIGRKPLGALFSAVACAVLVAPAGSAATPSTAASPAAAVGGVSMIASTVPAVCRNPARRGFWPTRAKVQLVAKRVPVLPVGRTNRIPNTPPLNSLGKRSFGWDHRGPAPGSHHGNVRFNAHTWPWGSSPALGNKMLLHLFVGQRIIVKNDSGQAICYKVTRRIEVRPTSYAARVGYYSTTGKPKLAIAVCSGRRISAGHWTRRTIWYAKPSIS
jgi:hypothetical protein